MYYRGVAPRQALGNGDGKVTLIATHIQIRQGTPICLFVCVDAFGCGLVEIWLSSASVCVCVCVCVYV